MNISSMTGFARADGAFEKGALKYAFVWEVKSVNAKGLDVKIKLPFGFEEIESEVKNLVVQKFARGTFSLFLNLQNESESTNVCIDTKLLNVLKDEVAKIYFENEEIFAKPSPAELLKISGVLKTDEAVLDDETKILLHRAIFETLENALQKLKNARTDEGQKIGKALLLILDEIDFKRREAEKIAGEIQSQIKDKILEQIKTFLADTLISSERLEQEVLFYVMRADVKEELDRLKAHVLTAHEIFEKGGNIGRALDFLCQELNRETNTLCSKSMDLNLTKIGMDLKALIEQFREQTQNME
ncbi:MAG: YicC family protein [Alphaproteobacteria bacterium]|nr:YicC family protein [Alphaproteobacteria bacterium]